ncbi:MULTISPECIES: sensor histidine kinase [Actinomyces]|uniref:histidine kinase n=1 Tax=Actinomyces oris TaxID=544580 RepID=A0A1Q8VPF9_9ACTO|nr:histidine kinase [Actinomyces oris]OLO49958.1 histidine kinase [Actinomyces oris]
MADVPVSSSAHARRVQILVWSGSASITVVQTLLALIAYLKLEGGSTVVPGLARWQVMYAGHLLISLACLLLLIPVLRGPRPSLPILIVVLGLIPSWPQVAVYVAATVIGMRKGARTIPVVVVATTVGVGLSPLLNPSRGEGALLFVTTYAVSTLPICIVCVMLGVNLQAREELLRSASREARLIRTTQEARIAQSRAEERARISREMHDSLAHRLSLVSLHAGALQTRTDLDMGSVRRIADSIHTLAADSGRELRQILAVLHDDGSADGARATWSDVEDVLSWEREAGQQIDLHLAESWADSFEAAGARSRHAVLRTIEELLTNARRHGAGGVVHLDCEVEASDGLSDDGAALVVRCVNDCPSKPRPTAPGGGLGLEGLRERLRLLGGELHVSQPAGQTATPDRSDRTEQPRRFVVMAAVPARGRAD